MLSAALVHLQQLNLCQSLEQPEIEKSKIEFDEHFVIATFSRPGYTPNQPKGKCVGEYDISWSS